MAGRANGGDNEVATLVPELFLFLKALDEVKVSGQHLSFNILW